MGQAKVTDVLLVRFLSGEVSDTERSEVLRWLGQSASNKDYFRELKLVWEQSSKAIMKSTVDVEDAWLRMKERLKGSVPAMPGKIRNGPSLTVWYKWMAAAAVILFAVGGSLLWYFSAAPASIDITVVPAPPASGPARHEEPAAIALSAPKEAHVSGPALPRPSVAHMTRHDRAVVARKDSRLNVPPPTLHLFAAGRNICNGTPCPLEICVTQSLKCGTNAPTSYSTCSALDPDESTQLSLKIGDKSAKNCTQTVSEIRITRLNTGESIVLDSRSSPATAQEVYTYLTWQKQGDILAGVFHSDCDNEAGEHTLRFDNNNSGHLILQ